MTEPLTFSVAGHPQGKGRARAFVRGGHVGHYTPEKTRSYEGMIRFMAQQEMAGREPMLGPVGVRLTALFDVPQSWSKTKKMRAITNDILPAKKPDLDNIMKAFVDAMNGVVFKDDCQIVHSYCDKRYGPAPQVIVTVAPI
jgi:Holliday junction resolvase RusA-like endonuclease